jgi:hypothetical protein
MTSLGGYAFSGETGIVTELESHQSGDPKVEIASPGLEKEVDLRWQRDMWSLPVGYEEVVEKWP